MKTILVLIPFLSVGIMLTNCSQNNPAETPPTLESNNQKISHEEHIKRGEYLVGIMGCNDCHSPKIMTDAGPAPDIQRLLSGHPSDEKLVPVTDKNVLNNYALFNMSLTAAIGPWGTSFAANLTPDEAGLGNWNIEQFEKALKHGKFKGMDDSRMLLPPMPWQNYSSLSNNDLAAIWAYLQSLPPVNNVVPAPIPPTIQ